MQRTSHTRSDATTPWIPASSEDTSPRPIDVDPAETGSFTKLTQGEGAHHITRHTAEADREAATISMRGANRRLGRGRRPNVTSHHTTIALDRPLMVGLIIFAAILLVTGILIVRSLLFPPAPSGGGTHGEPERAQVDVGESILHGGATYTLTTQHDGTFVLTYQSEESEEPQVLCTLAGTPVQLVLCNGTFVMPENLDGSWDVVAYVRGTSADANPVVDTDGKAVGDKGSITAVELDDSTLHVTTEDGTVTDVNLE